MPHRRNKPNTKTKMKLGNVMGKRGTQSGLGRKHKRSINQAMREQYPVKDQVNPSGMGSIENRMIPKKGRKMRRPRREGYSGAVYM